MAKKTFKLSGKPAGVTIVAGIDVHKHKLQVFVLGRIDREDRPLGEQSFGNDTTGRNEMCCFLDKYYPNEIVMEKTGKLSDPVLASIEKHCGWKRGVPRVSVVPPDTIKRFAGEPHTDPRSAYDLARLGISGLLNVSYLPSLEGQQLRELTRQAEHLTGQSTSLINEIKDKLSGLGYTLPDFTLTSAWGIALLKLLLADGINGNIAKIYELIKNGGVNLNAASRKALLDRKIQYLKYTHLSLSKFDVRLLNRLFAMLNMIEAFKASNSEHIEDVVNETPLIKDRVKVIGQITGISAPGAAVIAAEVDDMSRFQHARNSSCTWAGLLRPIAPASMSENHT
jgi:transposase